MMRKAKNNLLPMLLTGILVMLSSCGGLLEDRGEDIEPLLTIDDINVSTFEAELNNKEVTLKGSVGVNVDKLDQELVWGFMYRIDGGATVRMEEIIVGRGFYSGHFKIKKSDFPEGKDILYCAFINFRESSNARVGQLVGEEFVFTAR
jgi:hypothetical protein